MENNYMDKYPTPESFIRAEILANRSTDSIVTKSDLLYLIEDPGADICKEYGKLTKEELLDLLIARDGKEIYSSFPVGVSSHCFQLKFGISHKDVQRMAKAGFIAITGEKRFRMYGKDCYAKTYDPYAYYRLTKGDVDVWLATHKKPSKIRQGDS